MNKIERHKQTLDEIHSIYKEKNEKYGDSFSLSLDKYGLIAFLVRASDKYNRIENIIVNDVEDTEDERLIDSLKDLANYCLMCVNWIDEKNSK